MYRSGTLDKIERESVFLELEGLALETLMSSRERSFAFLSISEEFGECSICGPSFVRFFYFSFVKQFFCLFYETKLTCNDLIWEMAEPLIAFLITKVLCLRVVESSYCHLWSADVKLGRAKLFSMGRANLTTIALHIHDPQNTRLIIKGLDNKGKLLVFNSET